MAKELTPQQEIQLFDEISTNFDEHDPGLTAFNHALVSVRDGLNANGGYFSARYNDSLQQLNDDWPYHDQRATVTGKVYAVDDGIVAISAGDWGEAQYDERGTYFAVNKAELVSLGVMDVAPHFMEPAVGPDGTPTSPVEFVYGFNPDDHDADDPMFYAYPEDVLAMQYDLPTFDAIDMRLHQRWPREMAIVDKCIGKTLHDPKKLIRRLEHVIRQVGPTCFENDEFKGWLNRYIFEDIELDRKWPYAVTVEGPAHYLDDELEHYPITFEQPRTLYLKAVGTSIDLYFAEESQRAEISLVFVAPSARGESEGEVQRVTIPLSSIKDIQSTRPRISLLDIINDATADNEPNVTVDNVDGVAVEELSTEEAYLHPRIAEYRRLERLEKSLEGIVRKASSIRRTRYRSDKLAMHQSMLLSQWFHEELSELQLQESDVIRISGDGVIKPNAILGNATGKFHLDVDTEHPLVTPTLAADTQGYYQAILAEIDRFEDESGEFWQVSPKLILTTHDIQRSLVEKGIPLLSAAMRMSATAMLDGSTTFEIPLLDALRRRNQSLAALAMQRRGDTVVTDIRQIATAFMNERPSDWTEMGRSVGRVRRVAEAIEASGDELALEALREQLVNRKVQIVGDTWLGGRLSEEHHLVGIPTDVFMANLPDGSSAVVAAISPANILNEADKDTVESQLVMLRTMRALYF